MLPYRAAIVATALALVGSPSVAAAAHAPATADPAAVAALANEATQVVIAEQALIGSLGDGTAPASSDIDQQLRAVDDRGQTLLARFRALGVDLNPSTVVVLDRLPRPGNGFPPPHQVYDAAIADLARIAATPSAALPPTSEDGGPAIGLLAVAAVSLLALGAAALGNTLRRRESDEELAALAWSDGLTGLANRRRLDHDVATFDRGDQPVSAIMVDVDHFKSVNDTFGHQQGDEVLRRLAIMLEHHVRHDDIVYRYGGEEFCILLPGASHADATDVGRRIVDAARRITLPDGSNLTVSVGVAHGTAMSASESCQSADHALLAAKELGRDRAVDATTLGGSDAGPAALEPSPV